MKISDWFYDYWILFTEWFWDLSFVRYVCQTHFFTWLIAKKYIILAVGGAVIENSLLSISAGSACDNWKMFLIAILVATLASFLVDIFFFFLLRASLSKFARRLEKYPKITRIIKKFGIFGMLVYRFIPFARIPAMIFAVKSDLKYVISLNLLGSLLADFLFIGIGFFAIT